MSQQNKMEDGDRGTGRYPLRRWWQPVGLPPLLEAGDQRGLAAWFWPGFAPAPLFVPHITESTAHPSQRISRWRVSMDLAHFSASEISLCVRDGFLEVGGKHEEKPDEHGFIARCFTRKYRLPATVDATKMVSTLSVDGILTVEAPVPETSGPTAVLIPVKIENEDAGQQELNQVDQGEESRGDGSQPEGETSEKASGEPHQSAPSGEDTTDMSQRSSEQHETLEGEPGADGEIVGKKKQGSEGEEPVRDVAQSQVLEAGEVEQEHLE